MKMNQRMNLFETYISIISMGTIITVFSFSPNYCQCDYLPDAKKPWSNWWWPLKENINPNLYDPGEAMNQYDLFDVGKHS